MIRRAARSGVTRTQQSGQGLAGAIQVSGPIREQLGLVPRHGQIGDRLTAIAMITARSTSIDQHLTPLLAAPPSVSGSTRVGGYLVGSPPRSAPVVAGSAQADDGRKK
jgi:hypothetical protein